MNYNMEKFKATVLKDMGHVPATEALIHRVLIVRDEFKNLRVSVQAWWMDDKQIWQPGKGYSLSGRIALRIADYLLHALEREWYFQVIPTSNTQRYQIERDPDNKNLITIAKWWRKSDTEPWTMGKSLDIKLGNVEYLADLIGKAGSQTIHVR